MKKYFITLLLLVALPVMASHIVGGEFELLHLSGNTYQLNMILYFDKLNGAPGALDPSATVSIYRKRDNQLMGSVFLPLISNTNVGYTQPACSNGDLSTAKLIYTSQLTLSPDVYNDSLGYYMSWQRCCRNYNITNIYSDPPGDGISAGQTFYLEFPAVVKNGKPFYNSSPHLFPPLNDYACPGRPYYVNFAGVDDDHDSLVYTLVTPLNTTAAIALPPPSPGPYPPVQWRPTFGLDNIMDGRPDLRISLDGFITCTPTIQGLFVFAVKVEQYRDKQKIGESRRDFQMLVVDGCQPDQPPLIVGKKLTDVAFTYVNTMNITFDNTVTNDNRCIQVQLSDPDTQNPLYNYTQIVTLKAIPLNFKDTLINKILPATTTATLTHGGVVSFSVCFPQCPFIKTGPVQIGLVAYDNACSLPLTDTLVVTINVQPPFNTPPYFTIPNPLPVTQTLNEGDQATWPFQAVDNEHDTLVVSLVTDGFVLANAGMTFDITNQVNGLVQGQLHWDAYCDIYDFTQRTSFLVTVLVDDKDVCNSDSPVPAKFNLTVKLPGVADPLIVTDLVTDPLTLTREVGESLDFHVTGTQADGNFIKLGVVPKGFKLADHQIVFPGGGGNGVAVSPFTWDIRCNNVDLPKLDTYDFHFTVLDSTNKCRIHKTDTVEVHVKILPPDNIAPSLVVQSLNYVPVINNATTVTLGQPMSWSLLGSDPDVFLGKDSLTLKLIDASGSVAPKGYTFASAHGVGNVQSPFTWEPDCSIFENNVYSNTYRFTFSVVDNRCFNIKGDTISVDVTIKDVAQLAAKFNPPNVITPNGDHCNDYFALDGIDEDGDISSTCRAPDADAEIALPLDNCTGRFQFIRIYNRWGKQVFESTDRKFRWYALNQDAGEYYYLIGFTNRDMKGWVSVRP